MPLIKSLFTTLYSRIDHVVNRIENHDAVIERMFPIAGNGKTNITI
jgi:hypothetical protein